MLIQGDVGKRLQQIDFAVFTWKIPLKSAYSSTFGKNRQNEPGTIQVQNDDFGERFIMRPHSSSSELIQPKTSLGKDHRKITIKK